MSRNYFDLKPLIFIGVFAVLVIWICWGLIDLFLIDDSIRTSTPLVPKMEIVVKDNVPDTTYVYEIP